MVAASYFVVADTPLRRGGGEPSLASREAALTAAFGCRYQFA